MKDSVDTASPLPSLGWGGLSRRRFLKGALAVAGAATGGVSVTACAPEGGAGDDGRPLLFLDAGEAAIVTALAEALIPTQPGFPTAAQAQVVRRMDEELSFVGASIRDDLHAAIGALQLAPFLQGRFARFSKLDVAGRRAVLDGLARSRVETLRAVGSNLRLLVHFFYFGHPSTWAAIGYDGPFSHLPPIASEQRRHYAEKTGGGAA